MASTIGSLPPIPAPAAQLVDLRTGLMNKTWYLYFRRVDDHVREIEKRLNALEAP